MQAPSRSAIQATANAAKNDLHAKIYGAGMENEPLTLPTPPQGLFHAEETRFPEGFNPRGASNMPTTEKVNLWMQNIPLSRVDRAFVPDCYPAVAPSSSESSDVQFCSQTEDVVEMQAQIITRFATSIYQQETERAIPGDLDEDHIYDHELVDEHQVEAVLGDLFRDRPVYEAYGGFGGY